MITIPLRILLVEDLDTDVALIKRQLHKMVKDPVIEVEKDLKGCRYKLVNFGPDVVISDYNLPTCNGMEILEMVKSIDPDVPFIFLTGTIDDEELAANTILAGASGYILKKHMPVLDQKLEPLLKQVVFNMITKDDVRERIRKNKIAVNKIYQYLEEINSDNKEHQDNLKKIRQNLDDLHTED